MLKFPSVYVDRYVRERWADGVDRGRDNLRVGDQGRNTSSDAQSGKCPSRCT
jgi:hypothetical protein